MKFKLALIYEEGIRHACITMKWLEDKKIGKKRATITLLRILRTFISRWRDIYKNDFNLNKLNIGEEKSSTLYRDASKILHGFDSDKDKTARIAKKNDKKSVIDVDEKVEIKTKKNPLELFSYIICIGVDILGEDVVKKIAHNNDCYLLLMNDNDVNFEDLLCPVSDEEYIKEEDDFVDENGD